MSKLLQSLLVLGLMVVVNSPVQAEEGLEPIFDGKTFDGWHQLGGKADYEVVDGAIVGTSKTGTPNSFMSTKRLYKNFILELEFLPHDVLNCGIQIRSNCYSGPTTYVWKDGNGKQQQKTVSAGRVHGYQVEIDPSERAWSGGIYDEGRRGWLFNLNGKKEAQQAFKKGEWNHYRIEVVGDSIKTFVNGVPATDLVDDMTPEGFIALQVHSSKVGGQQIQWRNIRLKELP